MHGVRGSDTTPLLAPSPGVGRPGTKALGLEADHGPSSPLCPGEAERTSRHEALTATSLLLSGQLCVPAPPQVCGFGHPFLLGPLLCLWLLHFVSSRALDSLGASAAALAGLISCRPLPARLLLPFQRVLRLPCSPVLTARRWLSWAGRQHLICTAVRCTPVGPAAPAHDPLLGTEPCPALPVTGQAGF